MKKTRLGVGAKILIGVIVAGAAYLIVQERRQSARIDELATLPPCELAVEYARWRLDYEDARTTVATAGETSAEFAQTNELFEQAVREALRASRSPVLEALEDLTALDSESWIRERGNIDAFVQVMLAECPAEVEELMRESGRGAAPPR